MKVERIAKDKVRIFISYDDLEARGIDRDEIWQNGRKVQELFWDMMETAYEEVGFEIAGPISVEAFTMPTEGVVVIVTRVPSLPNKHSEEDDEDESSLELNMEYYSTFVFRFDDFEEVIRSAHAVYNQEVVAHLYTYRGAYYLYIEETSVRDTVYDGVWSIMAEYGTYAEISKAVLDEYGTLIIGDTAVETLVAQFPMQ